MEELKAEEFSYAGIIYLVCYYLDLKTDAAKAREPRYANKLNIDCLHPTSVSDDSGTWFHKQSVLLDLFVN